MALNQDKYDIEVRDIDAIKRNQIFFDSMQRTFSCLYGLYIDEEYLLIDIIKKYQYRKQSATEVERLNRDKKDRNKRKEGTYEPSPKKGYFVNKTTRTSRATSNTYNSNIKVDIPQWSKANNSEEEDIKCSRKSHIETVNGEVKGSSSEEEEIGIRKCRRRSQVEIVNKELKGCTY